MNVTEIYFVVFRILKKFDWGVTLPPEQMEVSANEE